jgi:hypothetical protein
VRALAAALVALLASGTARADPVEARMGGALVRLDRATLTLSTGAFTRTFDWNGGRATSRSLSRADGATLTLEPGEDDLAVPGLDWTKAEPGRLAVREARGDPVTPDHLVAEIHLRVEGIDVRRRCKVFPGSPAIGCAVALRGAAPPGSSMRETRGVQMIETDRGGARAPVFRVDRLGLPGRHWRAESVEFTTATDHNDTLVHARRSLLFRENQRLTGNVLVLSPEGAARGGPQVVLLRETPPGADQVGFLGHDWRVRVGAVEAVGSGFLPADMSPGHWTEAGAIVVALAGPDRFSVLNAVRGHMENVRPFVAARDMVATSNSWGDRSRDGRMSEAFMLREIEAAAALGLSHVQLDDGWQAGLSKNSANRAGRRWEDWSLEDWAPHPERFPRGLGPVVEAARAKGLDVGIWFNPSQADDYAAWARDAGIIVDLWRRHGIRQVKIDGIETPSWKATVNLAAFFETVTRETGGQVVFNVDVTAGRRPGYFALNGHGTLFLENRYTDWGNYHPHRTLRNLWMLAHWLPPQWFQIEFLNVARNPDRYAPGDPLAPAAVGLPYAFAVAMTAQPLAWMEVSGLTDAQRAMPEVRAFRAIQKDLQSRRIFPIGAEPDGASWTGFQSLSSDGREGHLIVHREPLAPRRGTLSTHWPAGARVRLEPVMGAAKPTEVRVGPGGAVTLTLPKAGDFAVWRHTMR